MLATACENTFLSNIYRLPFATYFILFVLFLSWETQLQKYPDKNYLTDCRRSWLEFLEFMLPPSVTEVVYCFPRRQLIFSFGRRVILLVYHSKGLWEYIPKSIMSVCHPSGGWWVQTHSPVWRRYLSVIWGIHSLWRFVCLIVPKLAKRSSTNLSLLDKDFGNFKKLPLARVIQAWNSTPPDGIIQATS